MSNETFTATRNWVTALTLALAILCGAPLAAKEKLPQVSDGLQLMKHTKLRAVYMKPGVTLEKYNKIALLDCYVEFEKNWQRDYNEDVVGLEQRVTTEDMDRIKKEVAEEFRKVFTEELEKKGGYPIVDNAAEDVLVLRPAIINLDVTAPDTMSPGMSMTIVASAGQMTLYLELYDSLSSDLIARIIDPEAERGTGMAEIGNSVTNTAAADRIMRRWADILRSHLGAVKAPPGKAKEKDGQS